MSTAQLWKPYESIKKFVPQCEVRGARQERRNNTSPPSH